MILRTEWDRAVEVLASSDEVVVACHVHPDGDALGSMIGLGRFLARLGKKVQVGWGSSSVRIPPQFAFLPGADSLSAPSQMPAKPETFVAIDCGGVSRLQLLQSSFEGAGTTINIDHHLSNTRFGEINLVDPEAASSSELAYELIRRTGGTPDLDEATCFYAGIVTDTGRFQHAGTSAATLRVAADLRELGADHERVALEVYESAAFAYLHVLGVVLSRAQLLDGLVWSWLDQQDLVGIGLDETEELIDVLRAVREGRVAMVLKQLGDGSYKVSLRSRGDVDVSAIAQGFGGGGHARAAGFSTRATVAEVVAAIKERIGSP